MPRGHETLPLSGHLFEDSDRGVEHKADSLPPPEDLDEALLEEGQRPLKNKPIPRKKSIKLAQGLIKKLEGKEE